MIAGRFLLFLVLFLLFHGVQFWPLGLFLRLRVQILLRSLFLGSPRPPLPHEMCWKHPFLPLAGGRGGRRSRSGRISETRRGRGRGRGRAGGPGVRGPMGRPGRSCGFGLFPSLRLRGFFPSWDPGAVCSVLSVRFSAGGKKEEKKGKPTSVVILKEKGLPPLCSLFFPPDFREIYNLEGFCFSSRLLGRRRRRRRRFTLVPQSPLSLRTPPGSSSLLLPPLPPPLSPPPPPPPGARVPQPRLSPSPQDLAE